MTQQETNGKTALAPQKKGILLTVCSVVSVIALLVGLFIVALNKPVILSDAELKTKGVFLFENPRSFKPVVLVDQNEALFSSDNFMGKWSLVFFGFTYCPDVCPTTLALLNQFYKHQQSEQYADDLQIVLVSVDPGRDTPQKMKDYVAFFNQDFVGVTGEFLNLHRFATQLNVPFSKVPGGGDNYTVEHGGNIAIVNPQGHYVGFFRTPLSLPQLNVGYQSLRENRE